MARSITIKDVAKKARISKSTVSRVISGNSYGVSEAATRRVTEAIEELGYVHNTIASSLRTSRTRLILLAIPDITNSFWAEVARGVQDEMDRREYAVVVANSDWRVEREMRYLNLARRHRFDAVLINAFYTDRELLIKLDCPVVLLGERLAGGLYDVVGTDTYAAVMDGLEYFYSYGHRRIAIAISDIEDNEGYVASRRKAYLDFHRKRNLELRPEYIMPSRLTLGGGQRLVEQILELEARPTALLCGNDMVAIGFLQLAAGRNLAVPADISIMGIDDIPSAALTVPALTTIRKPKYNIGETAAALLIKRIEGHRKSVPERVLLPGELVERDTVRMVEPER